MRKAKISLTLLLVVTVIAGFLSQVKSSITKVDNKSAVYSWVSVILLLLAVGILLIKVVTSGLWFMFL